MFMSVRGRCHLGDSYVAGYQTKRQKQPCLSGSRRWRSKSRLRWTKRLETRSSRTMRLAERTKSGTESDAGGAVKFQNVPKSTDFRVTLRIIFYNTVDWEILFSVNDNTYKITRKSPLRILHIMHMLYRVFTKHSAKKSRGWFVAFV